MSVVQKLPNEHKMSYTPHMNPTQTSQTIKEKLEAMSITLKFIMSELRLIKIPLLSAIVIAIFIYKFHSAVPKYFFCDSKIAIRSMLTNTVGLITLLTFATNNISNLSKKSDKTNTYLGEDVNSFILIQSQHSRILSASAFKFGPILLIILPIVAFEFPSLLHFISASWWGLFLVIASLLSWHLMSALTAFGANTYRSEHVRKRIKRYRQEKWMRFIIDMIGNHNGDPFYTRFTHLKYLEELRDIDPEDRNVYIDLTLGNIKIIDNIVNVSMATRTASPESKTEDNLVAILNFIAARQSSLIEFFLDNADAYMRAESLKLICETDSKYHSSIRSVTGVPTCEESSVSRLSLLNIDSGITPSAEIETKIELIPALVYYEISRGISEERAALTANEVNELITSINGITHTETKEYAAKQLIEAIITLTVIDRTADQKLLSDISNTIPCLTPGTSPVNDDEKLWRNVITSVSQQKIIEEEDLSIETQNLLLSFTGTEFRVAYLFVTLFKTLTGSHSSDIQLLRCITQQIDPIAFDGNDVGETAELSLAEPTGINLEATRKFISKFAKCRYLTPLPVFHVTKTSDWLFKILSEPVNYDLYDEFVGNKLQGAFDFATLILWRSIVSQNTFSEVDFLGSPYSGYFFQNLKSQPFDQLSGRTIEIVKNKVTKAADLLEDISRPEMAKSLRQSIETE